MSQRSDVVVIGAGHNALIAAAYLARGGLSVTVLEERDVPGGGTVTEELTLPGFRHDTASTGHMALQYNPVIAADELGLVASGLRYIAPDPAVLLHCADGETIALWRNLDATAREIARFSEADADAFRRLIADWDEILPLHLRRMAGAPGTVPDTSADAAAKWAAMAAPSAWDVIKERFEDEHTRTLLAWVAVISTQPLLRPGTGLFPVSLAGLLTHVSWPNVVGGSSALAEALVSAIEAHGGRVLCGRRVERIEVADGRATAVVTDGGERFEGAQAIVSGAHTAHTASMVGAEHLPEEFASLQTWRAGASLFVVHLALPTIPTYHSSSGELRAVVAGFGTIEGMIAQAKDLESGALSAQDRWMMAACSSVVDDTRAPEGQATLKLLTAAPYALRGDHGNWAAAKEDYADQLQAVFAAAADGYSVGDELARTIHSPADLEALNRHNIAGGHQGGEMTPDQMGPNRPVNGWSAYRMPVAGLYQTGTSTHPGGAVTGFNGRNAARAVLDDLGISSEGLMRDVDATTPKISEAALAR